MSRDRRIAASIGAGQARLAIIEEDAPVEVWLYRDDDRPWSGETLAGRVSKIVPEMEAAFVETEAGDVLLPLRRARKAGKSGTAISDIVHQGQAVQVRIARAAVPDDAKLAVADLLPDGENVETAGGLPALIADAAVRAGAGQVIIDDRETYLAARRLASARELPLAAGITLWTERRDLFEALGVAEATEDMTAAAIRLPSGGSIRIEPTRALTAIDVDSAGAGGGRGAGAARLQTNIEAAQIAARAVRFLGLGGNIVIDFIDMAARKDRERVLKVLDGALALDPARPARTNFSKFGLVEISRRAQGPSLLAQLREDRS